LSPRSRRRIPLASFVATTSPPTRTSNCPRLPMAISTFEPVAFSIFAARLAALSLNPQELQ
jgi:hypothetical protein